jgi:hypothetical protein
MCSLLSWRSIGADLCARSGARIRGWFRRMSALERIATAFRTLPKVGGPETDISSRNNAALLDPHRARARRCVALAQFKVYSLVADRPSYPNGYKGIFKYIRRAVAIQQTNVENTVVQRRQSRFYSSLRANITRSIPLLLRKILRKYRL